MSLLARIRRSDQQDRELETTTRIFRNQPQAISRTDIDRLEEERAPWLRKKRRGR